MDSESNEPESSLELASNIWTRSDGELPTTWEAARYVPGDLRVHFSDAGIDRRIIETVLEPHQLRELEAYQFFLPFGTNIQPYTLPQHPRD